MTLFNPTPIDPRAALSRGLTQLTLTHVHENGTAVAVDKEGYRHYLAGHTTALIERLRARAKAEGWRDIQQAEGRVVVPTIDRLTDFANWELR